MSIVENMHSLHDQASYLIRCCLYENIHNDKIVSLLGFFIALHKQKGITSINDYKSGLNIKLVLDKDYSVSINDIYQKSFSVDFIKNIVRTISSIIQDDCSSLFEEMIKIFYNDNCSFVCETIQPEEVTKLVSRLYGNSTNKSFYNPFASIASYQIEDSFAQFDSQEFNTESWLIGKIRLFLHDIDSRSYVRDNSMNHWLGDYKKYDAVFTMPPFGQPMNRTNEEPENTEFNHRQIDSYVIEKSLNSITENGSVMMVLTAGFLFGMNIYDFRKYLVTNGFAQTIVLLPPNIFGGTSISTVIVKFTRTPNEGIIMVDGSSFFIKEKRKNVLLYEDLLNTIELRDPKYVRAVSVGEIVDNDFNLYPPKYVNSVNLMDVPDGYRLYKFGDLVRSYNGIRSQQSKIRLVKGQDLASVRFDFEKTFEKIELCENQRGSMLLDKDLLLVLRIGDLKPTLFRYTDGIDIYCNSNIYAFEIDESIVSPRYLANELGKEYVTKQLIMVGSAIPTISKQNLLNIKILVPNLEIQKAVYDNDRSNYSLLKAKELGLEELLEKQKTDYVEEIRIKKHNLAQYIAGISSSVSALSSYINNNNLGDKIISARLNITLSDHIENLYSSISEMGQKIEFLTEVREFGDAEKVDLNKVLTTFGKKEDLYSVEYKLEELSIPNKIAIAQINAEDLKEVVNQIISNAVNHGFTDTKNENVICISLKYDMSDNMYVIEISNNGKPMPKGMNTKRYGIKGEFAGETGHTGIGGYRVKSIVEHFNGCYFVENDEDSSFPVQITIKLPKYN